MSVVFDQHSAVKSLEKNSLKRLVERCWLDGAKTVPTTGESRREEEFHPCEAVILLAVWALAPVRKWLPIH